MNDAWPVLIAEGAMGRTPGDFVAFFIHMIEYVIFVCVALSVAGAVPAFHVVGDWSFAVVEYPHHHLRWSSSLLVSHGFMSIRCFFGFLHMSAQCCCSVVFGGIRGHVLVRMCVLRLFMSVMGMGEDGHCTFPMVVFRCMRVVCE